MHKFGPPKPTNKHYRSKSGLVFVQFTDGSLRHRNGKHTSRRDDIRAGLRGKKPNSWRME
jgi:hypothetical protein